MWRSMQITCFTLIVTCLLKTGQSKFDPYIINGDNASIHQFPYSAFLYIKCANKDGDEKSHICGSSIMNQYLILTAAHCMKKCVSKPLITVYVGHEIWQSGASSTADSFHWHENYRPQSIQNDICIVKLKTPLQFSMNVNRVALMENPPYYEEALVAGWGRTKELHYATSDILLYAKQYVKNRKDCEAEYDLKPNPGIFCTEDMDSRPAQGDSGSALVVRSYVQIGLVSHALMKRKTKKRTVFYTDTGYYYNWIAETSNLIMCVHTSGDQTDSPKCSLAREDGECDEARKKV